MNTLTGRVLPLVTLAVGFALGIGVGLSWEVDREREPRAASARDVTDAGASASRLASVEETSSRPNTRPRRRVPADRSATSEHDVAPRGTGEIGGLVVDASGRPLAGALLRATWTPRSRRRAAALPLTEHRVETRSGEDGTYRLAGLHDVTYRLTASKLGYEMRAASGATGYARPGVLRDWVGVALAAVEIRPELPDGSRPKEADVDIRTGSTYWDFEWTDGQPVLYLGPGEHVVGVTAGDLGQFAIEDVHVSVESDTRIELPVRLSALPGIAGTVRFEGEPPQEFGVAVQRLSTGAEAVAQLGLRPNIDWYVETEYARFGLESGRYRVGVVSRIGRVLTYRDLEVRGGPVRCDLVVPDVPTPEFVQVRALSPAGRPLVDVHFEIRCHLEGDDLRRSSQEVVAERIDDGWFRVPLTYPGGRLGSDSFFERDDATRADVRVDPLRFQIAVSSPGFSESVRPFVPGQDDRLVVRLQESARLTARIEGVTAGNGQTQWYALLRGPLETSPEQRKRHDVDPAAGGRVRFGPIAPGRYEVIVGLLPDDDQGSKLVVVERTIELRAGENDVSLRPRPVFRLVVRHAPGSVNPDLDVHADGAAETPSVFFREGHRLGDATEFRDLPPGTYRVRQVGRIGRGEQIVKLSGDLEIPFRPRPYDGLRVVDLPSDDPSGLRMWDVIVAVGNIDLATPGAMQKLSFDGSTGGRVRLRVLRGGREVEVSLDADVVLSGISDWLEPWTR